MSHIFISYSHKDSLYVHKLAEALEQEGFGVWIDDRIHYGSEWPKVVTRNLDASDGVIVVLSNNSYESDMVQNEVARAREKQKPIFPLLLEGENWLIVQTRQSVDITDGSLPTEKFYKRLEGITPRKNERAEREAAEKAEREKTDKLAREKLEREVAEKSQREKTEREAAEKVAQVNTKREATEKARREKANRRAVQIIALKEKFSKSFTSFKSAIHKTMPFLRIGTILGVIIVLFWIGSWALSQFPLPLPTAEASLTAYLTSTIGLSGSSVALPKTVVPGLVTHTPTPTQSSTPTPTNTMACTSASGEVMTEFVWLRTGPGVHYRALGIYDKGVTVTILGKSSDGEWLVVSLPDGKEGWVSSSSIRTSASGCNLAIATAPFTQTPLPTPDLKNPIDPCTRYHRLYSRLLQAYGTSSGDPNYDSGADLNGDGHIDIFDYQLLSNQWPEGCPNP